jgi:outer membrane protein assembly factor BamE (lipoprotein component of BamABCDE complex)
MLFAARFKEEQVMSGRLLAGLVICFCPAFLVGCASTGRSNITPGAAKKHIQPGVTTMAEVVEIFGSPNVLTRQDGVETWVYDKVSSRQTTAVFGLGAGGVGDSAGGLIGGGLGTTSRSETTVMLIIYFDEDDIVSDYKITQTKF